MDDTFIGTSMGKSDGPTDFIQTNNIIDFDRSQICQSPEDSHPSTSKTVKQSIWKWRCDGKINKERIRRHLYRSKTTVEEHVCYPWLRRLFFHLSNYFPNLHTTRSSSRKARQRVTDQKPRESTYYASVSTGSRFSDLTSQSRLQHDSQNELKRSTIKGVKTNMSSTNYDNHKDTNFRSKRRPLQRQKSSGILEFDVNLVQQSLINEDRKLSESSTGTSSIYGITKNVPRERVSRLPRRKIRYDHLLQSSNSSSNDFTQSGSPKLCTARLNPESQSQLSFDDCKPVIPKSVQLKKTKTPNIGQCMIDGDRSPSEYSEFSSNHGMGIPRSGIVRNELSDVFTDNASITGRLGTNMSPISGNIKNSTGKYGLSREASESQYCIQFKRVKARRTSSNSQAEYGPPNCRNYDFDLNGRDRRIRNHIHDRNHCMAVSSPHMFYGPANMLPQERGPVKKHVETWLKEAVNRTIQKKNLRRGPISHVSSGDAQHEPPEAGTPQPHSFDGPVPRFPEDIYYNTHYTRTVGKHVSSSLHTSTESPHIIPPTLTKNNSDAYVAYGETVPESAPNTTEAKVFSLMFEESEKLYRRHSAHPMSEIAEHQPEVMGHESISPGDNIDEILDQAKEALQINGSSDRVSKHYISAIKPQLRTDSFQENNAIEVEDKTRLQQKRVMYPVALSHSPGHTAESPLKQSKSFSGPRRNSKVLTAASPIKNKTVCPISERCFSSHLPRQAYHPGRLTIPTEIDSIPFPITTSQGLIYNGQKRGSNYSSIIPGQLSIDSSELRNVAPMGYHARRYSRHLKPLDAWNSRQSHSMEIVNPHSQHQRSSSSPQKHHQLSKQATIRKLPAIYSRSLQHSTCSFPAQWGGFLSGPTLSLTSPFDSSSITPDSQNTRHFFQTSLDSHDPKQSHNKVRRYGHAHSASESPGYIQSSVPITDKPLLNNSLNVLRYSRSSLSPRSYDPETTRKVQSFELNLAHEQFPDVLRHSSALLKVHEKSSPLQNSYHSSRRGSSMSNNSMFLPKDCKAMKTSIVDGTSHPIPNVSIPLSKPLEKLIPPDLIFSPASRRASMMDDDEVLAQNTVINNSALTDALTEGSTPVEVELIRSRENSTSADQPIPSLTKKSRLLIMNSNDSQRQLSNGQHHLKYMQRHKSADVFMPQNDHGISRDFCSPKRENLLMWPVGKEANICRNTNLSAFPMGTVRQSLWLQPNSPNKDMGGTISHCKSLTDFIPAVTRSDIHKFRSSMDFEPHLIEKVDSEANVKVVTSSRNLNAFYHKTRDTNPIDFRPNPMFKVSLASGDSDYLKTDKTRAPSQGKILTPYDKKINVAKGQATLMPSNTEDLYGRGNIATHSANYLFRSTSSIETCVNPQLLQPSLRPVIDSSEENMSDVCENDTCHDLNEQNRNPKLPLLVHDSHAARRRSFLARYWQHAVQQSGDTSVESFETRHSVDIPAEHQKEQSIIPVTQKPNRTPHKQTNYSNKSLQSK